VAKTWTRTPAQRHIKRLAQFISRSGAYLKARSSAKNVQALYRGGNSGVKRTHSASRAQTAAWIFSAPVSSNRHLSDRARRWKDFSLLWRRRLEHGMFRAFK